MIVLGEGFISLMSIATTPLYASRPGVIKWTGNVAKIGDSSGKSGTLITNSETKIDWSKVSSLKKERLL
jgi:hypothetical protein